MKFNSLLQILFLLACTSLFFGCAVVPMPEIDALILQNKTIDARVDSFYIAPFDGNRIKQRSLRSLGSVQSDFRDQLYSVLKEKGLFHPTSENDLHLQAELVYWQDLNEFKPLANMEMTIRYTVSTTDGTELMTEKIMTTGEASGLFLVGATYQCVRAANNSLKKNIEKFSESLAEKLPAILSAHLAKHNVPESRPVQAKAETPIDTKGAMYKISSRQIGRLGNYHALIIGNNAYRHLPPLRTAVNDAESIAKILSEKYRYKVKFLKNATRKDILRTLTDYRSELGEQDNLLIYYAGHGWLDAEADEGYWLPVDATTQDPTNWISNSAVTGNLKAIKSKHVMVIADSCYSGKMTRGIKIVQRDPNFFDRLITKRSRTVLASGGLEPVADDGGNGDHSVFASAVLQVLESNTGVIDGSYLFEKIVRPVKLNADQTPEYADMRKAGHEDGGDFIFASAD